MRNDRNISKEDLTKGAVEAFSKVDIIVENTYRTIRNNMLADKFIKTYIKFLSVIGAAALCNISSTNLEYLNAAALTLSGLLTIKTCFPRLQRIENHLRQAADLEKSNQHN